MVLPSFVLWYCCCRFFFFFAAAAVAAFLRHGQLTARLIKLGGQAWAKFLDPRDSDRYDVMRLRLVVRVRKRRLRRMLSCLCNALLLMQCTRMAVGAFRPQNRVAAHPPPLHFNPPRRLFFRLVFSQVQLKDKIAQRLKWASVVVKLLVTHVQYIGFLNALVGMRPLVW